MTNMQQDAMALIQKMPESQLEALLIIMRSMNIHDQEIEISDKHQAFEELERLRRPIPDLDEKVELSNWRKEKFGYACSD